MKSEMILVKNGLVQMPEASGSKTKLDVSILGTLFNNLSYYGYVLSKEATAQLIKLTDNQAKEWWASVEPFIKEVTGASKRMDRFVVYKNFPRECLEMSQCEYWVKQILMYIGCPNEYFTETEEARDKIFEKVTLKVLQPAKADSLQTIYRGLLQNPARWTEEQYSWVRYFVVHQKYPLDVKLVPFKENLVKILAEVIQNNLDVVMSSATDVLRLAVALSDGDVTFKTNTKFRNFPRSQRRFLLKQLEGCGNLEEDVARDRERWKKLFKALHPGDYDFENVSRVYNKLYKDKVKTFNSRVEEAILLEDTAALKMLQGRPGDFVRRLHKMIDVYGVGAVKAFIEVLPKLKTIQLLKIQKYLLTIDNRLYLAIAPKGNWSKLKVLPNEKSRLDGRFVLLIDDSISKELKNRLSKTFKNGVVLCDRLKGVKLQTNDSDIMPYGRGTVFELADNIKFIRSASYWKNKAYGTSGYCNLWYDNGWNFFDSNWKSMGACCWSECRLGDAAIFSGDPTSSKDKDGNACQMIDLYIDKLIQRGVRYAVWNILCYSRVDFSKSEVYGALQLGEEAQKGGLFEPSRCQFMFRLNGEAMTKYVAYLDLEKREIVYIDANLKGCTHSAANNGTTLEAQMPAYVEYLEALPSVWDLFQSVSKKRVGTPAVPVLYSDEKFEINGGNAYVFKPSRKENKYTQLTLSEYL